MQKKTLAVAGAGIVAALALTAFVGSGIANERHHRSVWGHHGPMGGPGGHGFRLMEEFDANQDGKLTRAEIDTVRQNKLGQFDANGDGNLTLDEFQALWLDFTRPRMVDRFQAFDDDGDAVVTGAEFQAPFERMVAWLDRDGNGEITRDELRRPHHGREGRHDGPPPPPPAE